MAERYRHSLRVRFQECDPQGVVYFARYLDHFDVALTELWRERMGGYAEMVAAGADVVVAEASVRYRAPARFDDVICVAIAVERVGATSVVFAADVLRDEELLAQVRVRQVCIDPATKEKRPLPDALRQALAALEAEASEPAGIRPG